MDDLRPIIEHFAVRPALPIEPLGAAGGMSGELFWRFDSPRGRVVLRRWPVEHPSAERLRFIHAVLRHAVDRGCTFVPAPIAASTGETFVVHGRHLWELSPWMPGEANYEQLPSPAKLAAALRALASFHNAVADFPLQRWPQFANRTNAVAKHLARLRDLQTGRIDTLQRAIDNSAWPELVPLAREFIAILPRALPNTLSRLEPLAGLALPLQPCLRDIWHDHVLFTGDEVTGVVDFGTLDIDTPATDVARLLGSLVGDDRVGWQTGLAAYIAVRPLSPQETQAVTALDASGMLLAGCNWIRWIYVEGRQFESPAQVIARFTKLLERVRS